jgi:lysophospholipase L1-like esterase
MAAAALCAVVVVALTGACTPAQGHPSGARNDRPTSSPAALPTVQVVGLGDSVTAGTACGCEDFVRLYADSLGRRWHRVVHETNLGVGGQTSAGLLAALQGDARTRTAVAAGDVVLVTIGANDLVPALRAWDRGTGTDVRFCGGTCDTADVDRIGRNIEAALDVVRRLRRGQPALVLVTTYWNVFEDGDAGAADRGDAYLDWSDQLTRRLNARVRQAALAEHATPVDLYGPFKAGGKDPTPLLADDGDHPDAAGHEIIATSLLAATPASAAAPTTS